MINRSEKRKYLIGYAHKDIKTYTTKIKPLGYVVAGLGFVCLGVAVFPNGLGVLFYPLGFSLLGLVGIRFSVRNIYNKFACTRRFL